jgi:exonuclease SbcD
MRFIHLADLHLGKKLNEFSLIDDQRAILAEIVQIAEREKPDAVLIAGDIYDKSVPSIEAVQLLDGFLNQLHTENVAVFLISGNHDSVERMGFAASLLHNSNVYISQAYTGEVSPIELTDEHGLVRIWLLPYLKPASVRPYFPDSTIESYSDALRVAVETMDVDTSLRNILVAHQFVTGAVPSESEELYVGGLENIEAALFDPFDYVALGHIHRPQRVMRETLRYAGTPLKYSLSEVGHTKSVTLVDLGEKCGDGDARTTSSKPVTSDIAIKEIPLAPLRDVREIRGSYTELTARENYATTNLDDYVHVTLTDEQEEPNALMKLRVIYPRLIRLDYDNARTQANPLFNATPSHDRRSPLELFGELYELQNGQPMSDSQEQYARDLLTIIAEEKA